MYSFVSVVFLATLSVQIGAVAAASSADGIHDAYVNSLAQYLVTLPQAFNNEWPSFSAHELRTTELGNRMWILGNQLSETWRSGTCVDELRNEYTGLKNQAVDAYQKCAGSLTPSLDSAEFDSALGALKTLDNQIQQIQARCNSMQNRWAKRACQMNVQGQLMGLYMLARSNRVLPVYNDARNTMIESGDRLVSCILDSTSDILDQVVENTQKFYECPVDS